MYTLYPIETLAHQITHLQYDQSSCDRLRYRLGVWTNTGEQTPLRMLAAPLFIVAQVRLILAPVVARRMLWT